MKKQITMERTWQYPLADVWELWTTSDGIESWWGPDGFRTRVHALELRVGGTLQYSFTAVGKEQIAFMEKNGQPLVSTVRARYTAVSPMTLVAWDSRTDFIPDVEPYEVETRVELEETAQGVVMRLKFDVMHNEMWTQMAKAGWENELQKLSRRLEERKAAR
jgi:uncharacterized protein YndB with AHSA1/START domain